MMEEGRFLGESRYLGQVSTSATSESCWALPRKRELIGGPNKEKHGNMGLESIFFFLNGL